MRYIEEQAWDLAEEFDRFETTPTGGIARDVAMVKAAAYTIAYRIAEDFQGGKFREEILALMNEPGFIEIEDEE